MCFNNKSGAELIKMRHHVEQQTISRLSLQYVEHCFFCGGLTPIKRILFLFIPPALSIAYCRLFLISTCKYATCKQNTLGEMAYGFNYGHLKRHARVIRRHYRLKELH